MLSTRCPYTFRPLANPASSRSEYVDRDLPRNWANSGTICFAMAGARNSGKSVYLAMLIKLLEQYTTEIGGVWAPANEETREIYDLHFGKRLFEEKMKLDSTRPASDNDSYTNEPLIFSMGRHTLQGDTQSQNIFVVFKDVAGEDLENPNVNEVRDALSPLRNAHEIIFLFDPLADEDIRNALQGHPSVAVDSSFDFASPSVVLQNLMDVLEDARPHIAITMSKFDIVQQVAKSSGASQEIDTIMRNRGAAFNREGAGVKRPWDANDQKLLDHEIRSLLERLNARVLFNQLNNYAAGDRPFNFNCFAVSALGSPTVGESIDPNGFSPFRVLDPVRFVFDGLGLKGQGKKY